MRQDVAQDPRPGPSPAKPNKLEHSASHPVNHGHVVEGSRRIETSKPHRYNAREHSPSMSNQQAHGRNTDVHGQSAQASKVHPYALPIQSARDFVDGPASSGLALNPVGYDTLPSSFHVDSAFSRALLRGDTMTTWALGSQQDTARSWATPSQQDTARSRRPEPVSNPTTAPSSQASDKLPFHPPYHGNGKPSRLSDSANRPSFSSTQSSTNLPPPADTAPQEHAPRSAASANILDSATTVSSSNFQLAAKHGSNRRSQPKQAGSKYQSSGSRSYELHASGTLKQEASLVVHSSMSGVFLVPLWCFTRPILLIQNPMPVVFGVTHTSPCPRMRGHRLAYNPVSESTTACTCV